MYKEPYKDQYPPGYAIEMYNLILLIRIHTHKYEESEWSIHSPYTSASLLVSTYLSPHTLCIHTHYSTFYCSAHHNIAQIWSWCSEYSSSVVNRYPAIYVILRVGGLKMAK